MTLIRKKLTYVIIGVTILSTVCIFLYGKQVIDDLVQLRQSEVNLFSKSQNLDREFREFQRALGFGGFIHNVKEYLLTRHSRQLFILEANIQEVEQAYAYLRESFKEHESLYALKTLDDFVISIRSKYDLLIQPENQQLTSLELDNLLNIETPEILSALITLESLKDYSSNMAIRTIKLSIDDLVSHLFHAAILLPIVLFIGIILSWLLHRAAETGQKLEKSESNIRQIILKSPVAMVLVEANNLILCNDKFTNEYGYIQSDIPTIESWRNALFPDMNYREKVQSAWNSAVEESEATDTGISGQIWTLTCKDGSDRTAILQMVSLEDVDIITMVDITNRLKLEKQLNQAQKMEAIGTLAAGIAHDFNNILGAIIGYAQMALDDCPEGSRIGKDVTQVVKAGHRAKDLVTQILAFSRQVETENIQMQPRLIIKEVIKMLRSSLPSTIAIIQDVNADLGTILADPIQIYQVLMNLCTNAFHAMEETGGTLTVSLRGKKLSRDDLASEQYVQPGDFVLLAVGDTGTGILPEIRDKIFDPYFTTKEKDKGSGMGLSIVHGIVSKLGGFISCHSAPGEGTVFHVYLPVIADTVVPETQSVDLIPRGNEHILYVDDEELLADMGKNMLERLGYRVTTKTSSIEALTAFENQPDDFDLVITDQTMPGMTGKDLARRMLQMRPGLPIILCTGFSHLISAEQVKSLGIKGFAMKPLAKKDLAALIRKVLA